MDARDPAIPLARAEFYLCLARAFMLPTGSGAWTAMRDHLADDLADLGAALGYDIGAAIGDYQREMACVGDAADLLAIYSALFVAPPRPVQINAGIYLDGAVDGGSVRAMEAAYRGCGLARNEGFRDLSDHVAVQLEFVAFLWAGEADSAGGRDDAAAAPSSAGLFLNAFPGRWLAAFRRDLAAATATCALAANPYLPLADMLAAAVAHDAVAPREDARAIRHRRAMERARARHAGNAIGAGELAEIARKLRERGLAIDHLATPPGLRDAEHGWHRRRLPDPRDKTD